MFYGRSMLMDTSAMVFGFTAERLSSAGRVQAPPSGMLKLLFLFIVRGFLGDDDVVNVALAQARHGHPKEF